MINVYLKLVQRGKQKNITGHDKTVGTMFIHLYTNDIYTCKCSYELTSLFFFAFLLFFTNLNISKLSQNMHILS